MSRGSESAKGTSRFLKKNSSPIDELGKLVPGKSVGGLTRLRLQVIVEVCLNHSLFSWFSEYWDYT